jgi:hypothetical protein
LVRALEDLKSQQIKTGNSFSISVHFGPAVIATTPSDLGGALSGPGVGFLLRLQYQAHRLSLSRIVSASAQAELIELLPLTRMGVHLLPGGDLEETLYTY